MVFKLFPELVPKTCENFTTLSKRGYYNGLTFHRIIESFMIQGGCPRGDGTGGESCWGGSFADEFSPTLKHDTIGTLAMANSGPSTNGSQFYITTSTPRHLDGKHSVFGKIVSGKEVLTAISKVKVSKDDKPYEPVKINSITVQMGD